jgi:hypothetical protein
MLCNLVRSELILYRHGAENRESLQSFAKRWMVGYYDSSCRSSKLTELLLDLSQIIKHMYLES